MQFLYEIFPVFLFFMAFKWYGIYTATKVGIIATFLQAVINRLYAGQWDKKQVVTFLVFVLFGGMTLYFHDPIFVKWKPTIVFWIFSLVILFTQVFTQKPLMQRLMEKMLEGKAVIPLNIWQRINLIWAFFFIVLGGINLYIAYRFDNDIWVNFKFYGITSAMIVLSIAQALYLTRYMSEEKNNDHSH